VVEMAEDWLDEILEENFRSHHKLIEGTVAPNSIYEWWGVVREHLFTPVKEVVSALPADPRVMRSSWGGLAIFFTLGAFLPFSWLLVNMPEFERTSIVYLIIYLAASIILSAEAVDPSKYPFAAAYISPYLHFYQEVAVSLLGYALLGATANFFTGSIVIPLEIKPEEIPTFIPSLIIVGFSVPIVEWMGFHGVLMPSSFKWFGAIPSLLFLVFLFPAFHWLVYSSKMNVLIMLAVLQLICNFIYFATRSAFPALVIHILNNVNAVIHSFYPAAISVFGVAFPFSTIMTLFFLGIMVLGMYLWSPSLLW